MATIDSDVSGSDSLKILCERACASSEDAFEAIVKLEQNRLAKTLGRWLSDSADAPIREEVLQYTWLAFWQRACQLAKFLNDAEIRAYMTGVLRRLFFRVLKNKYRATGVSSLNFDPLDEWSPTATHSYCGYSAEEFCNIVARLLARGDRDVFELRRLGGTRSEISKRLEMSRSLVLSSYRRINDAIHETAVSLGIDLQLYGDKDDSK